MTARLRLAVALVAAIGGLGAHHLALAGDDVRPTLVPVQHLSCPAGAMMCSAGRLGGGGCYLQGRAFCVLGMVCPNGMAICQRGPRGAGGCYNPQQASCNAGAIVVSR